MKVDIFNLQPDQYCDDFTRAVVNAATHAFYYNDQYSVMREDRIGKFRIMRTVYRNVLANYSTILTVTADGEIL